MRLAMPHFSTCHLTRRPESLEAARLQLLTAQQAQHLMQHGYVVIDGVLGAEQARGRRALPAMCPTSAQRCLRVSRPRGSEPAPSTSSTRVP